MILLLVNAAAYSVRVPPWLDVSDGSDHYGSRRDERTALRFAYVLRVCAQRPLRAEVHSFFFKTKNI